MLDGKQVGRSQACKVVILTNVLAPYRIPLFNLIAEADGIDATVLALANSEANRQWKVACGQNRFGFAVLRGWHGFVWRWEQPIHLNWGLGRAMRGLAPDVIIISGYDSPAYWQAFFHAKMHRKPFVLCSESTLLSTRYTRGPIGFLKSFIIHHADAYIAFGRKSAEYLESFGAPIKRTCVGIDTVDMNWFRDAVTKHREGAGFSSARAKYPKTLLLFVGQLIARKGLGEVLKALARLRDSDTGLLVVGSGALESELKRFCRETRLENVYFEGYRQQDSLAEYYALADVLVLPSFKEVWGLVVNEALAGGLYVLCSDRAGAGYDLIRENWNGELFDPSDVGDLAGRIAGLGGQIDEIRSRREAISRHACAEYSIEKSAQAFIEAIRKVC